VVINSQGVRLCEIESTCLRNGVLVGLEPVLVHDPVRLPAVGRSPSVEHEGLPHADEPAAVLVAHRLVPPRRLPEPRQGGPVRPRPRRVLAVLVAEEVPVALLLVPDLAVIFMKPCIYDMRAESEIRCNSGIE
jgi:hypothetical protein